MIRSNLGRGGGVTKLTKSQCFQHLVKYSKQQARRVIHVLSSEMSPRDQASSTQNCPHFPQLGVAEVVQVLVKQCTVSSGLATHYLVRSARGHSFVMSVERAQSFFPTRLWALSVCDGPWDGPGTGQVLL